MTHRYLKTLADVTSGQRYWLPTAGEDFTAETQAADAEILTAKTLDVTGNDTTVSFGASDGTANTADVYSAGVTAQSAMDLGDVQGQAGKILNTQTIIFQNNDQVPGEYDLAAHDTSVASGQHDTDAAFLETNKIEITPTATAILAEFGVTGTAAAGGSGLTTDEHNALMALGTTDVPAILDAIALLPQFSDIATKAENAAATVTALQAAGGVGSPAITTEQTNTVTGS
jgi:hypothetical protein